MVWLSGRRGLGVGFVPGCVDLEEFGVRQRRFGQKVVGLLGYFFVDYGLVSRKVTIRCWVFTEVCRFEGIWG